MWRFTRFSDRLNSLKFVLFAAAAVTVMNSCADGTGPSKVRPDDGITIIEYHYPDSVKFPVAEAAGIRQASAGFAGSGMSANVVVPSGAALSTSGSVPSYKFDRSIPFEPEAAPTRKFDRVCNDCVYKNTPIGFDFTFFGHVYNTVNVGSNGIVGFGPIDDQGNPVYQRDGCCTSGFIARNDVNNNLIALGWTVWTSTTLNSIKYETRGVAPNRRFILQFTNVMESGAGGHITAQLVLYEHSNDIVLYTTELNTFARPHTITQGIENMTGSEALFVPERDSAHFSLANDAVKFSVTAANQAPAITPQADLAAVTNAGACVANVSVQPATASDDAPGVAVSYARSDDAAASLDAPFKKGVTTITWTAKDAEGLVASATQKVTVSDKENPVVEAPADILVSNDPGRASAVVAAAAPEAHDNCGTVSVTGSLDGGLPLPASYPVGSTQILWVAKDASGNSAMARQTVTVVDKEAPSLIVPADFAANATTPSGAIVTYVLSTADNVAVTSVSCDHPSGSLFPIGYIPVSCTASDAAGNQVSKEFHVRVLDANAQIQSLIEYVNSLELKPGAPTALINQLLVALRSPSQQACRKMDDFLRIAAAQDARIPATSWAYMVGEAHRIQSVLGCVVGH